MQDERLQTKMKVYEQIVQYLEIEGEPTEADTDFKEGNISHLVNATISSIVRDFRPKTGCKSMQLRSENVIVSMDGETGGSEEFVVMDLVLVTNEKFVLIIEAKRTSLGQSMKQYLLTMKDRWGSNSGGVLYGFVTTGESWRMIRYGGILFEKIEKVDVLFDSMGEDQQRWIMHYSALVDCMNFTLETSTDGIVETDMAVEE